MSTLNFCAAKSPIEFKIIEFPDGQQDVVVIRLNCDVKSPLRIVSRFNGFKDLELILSATAALRNLGATRISLSIPYLLGARSDRQFVQGGTSYLRDVIAPIINSQNYERVDVLDPHSDVSPAVVKNLNITGNTSLVAFAVQSISYTHQTDKFAWVSPDAGALKKIYDLAKSFSFTGDIVVASKHREVSTGKITGVSVPMLGVSPEISDFLIIDDICDGGRTFIEIAKKIHQDRQFVRIHLVVTHGIFSQGLDVLSEHINSVFTTNSIGDDIKEGFLHRINVLA